MVEPTSVTGPTTAVQEHLRATTARWLVTRPHMSVSFSALAGVVGEMLIAHTAALRAMHAAVLDEIADLEGEPDQGCGEHADRLGGERAGLWRLLKEQTRNARALRSRLAYWQVQARLARVDADRADREIRAALGAPVVGGAAVEWAAQLREERDAFARESDHREIEIVDLIGQLDIALAERDKALDRIAELESALAAAGER